MLIGNIIGSSIFNIGIPVVLFGGISGINFSYLDLTVLIVSALMLFVASLNDQVISKKEGLIMILTFIVYYSYVIIG